MMQDFTPVPMSLEEMRLKVDPRHWDELDAALIRCIENGYVEWWGMSQEGSPVFALAHRVTLISWQPLQGKGFKHG